MIKKTIFKFKNIFNHFIRPTILISLKDYNSNIMNSKM